MPLLPAYRRPARPSRPSRPTVLASLVAGEDEVDLARGERSDLALSGSGLEGPVATAPTPLAAHVTAVLVAHDGARWLPRTLAALGALSRPPDHLVAVDTASLDTSSELLRAAFGPAAVLVLPRRTGFGTAVTRGLQHAKSRPSPISLTVGSAGPPDTAPLVEWIWLLHDDVEPAPDSLARLLETASGDPTIGIVGPKHHGGPMSDACSRSASPSPAVGAGRRAWTIGKSTKTNTTGCTT